MRTVDYGVACTRLSVVGEGDKVPLRRDEHSDRGMSKGPREPQRGQRAYGQKDA